MAVYMWFETVLNLMFSVVLESNWTKFFSLEVSSQQAPVLLGPSCYLPGVE